MYDKGKCEGRESEGYMVAILSACAVGVEINSNFQYQVNGEIPPKND